MEEDLPGWLAYIETNVSGTSGLTESHFHTASTVALPRIELFSLCFYGLPTCQCVCPYVALSN